MTKVNSSTGARTRKPHKPKKPNKPHKDFPLTAHPSGLWCKKVRGKSHYFGPWADHQGALDRWLAEKDDLLAGRVPRSRAGVPTLVDLTNKFLKEKGDLRDAGELSPHYWNSLADVCDELVDAFGPNRLLTDLLPEDFAQLRVKWAERWGKTRLGAEITRTRTVFNYAYENRLIPAPIVYGSGFAIPSAKIMRQERNKRGEQMFEADELRRMIDAATQPLKTMLLLGINAALGNADIAKLPITAIDLDAGWMKYPRGKTGIMRRCPLWPETVQSLRVWLAQRPAPKDAANHDLVFITARGNAWERGTDNRAISHECRKLIDKLGIDGDRNEDEGRNYYALRHSWRTIADKSRDEVAINVIMGHDDKKMANRYRERIDDERLQEVVDIVHGWLFAEPEKPRLKIAPEGNADAAATG
jgi:integrase